MGVADLVPGVSGGTIAFALGIHPKLLTSLKTLKFTTLRHPGNFAWFFLSAIVLGILTSLALGSHLIYYLLNHVLYQSVLRALFLGLVLGSIFYCIKKILKWSVIQLFCLFIGAIAALSLCFFNYSFASKPVYDVPVSLEKTSVLHSDISNYDFEKMQLTHVSLGDLKSLINDGCIDPDTWIYNHEVKKVVKADSCFEFAYNQVIDLKYITGGALAICAMLLPGISGSQVMQLFGIYEPVIEAITVWTKQLALGKVITPSFWLLFNVGLGILIGIAFFSRFFVFLYRKYYYATLSLLVGFMMGSLPSLWPFWSLNYKVHLNQTGYTLVLQRIKPQLPQLHTLQTWLVFFMIIAGVLILLSLEKLEQKKQQETLADEEYSRPDTGTV